MDRRFYLGKFAGLLMLGLFAGCNSGDPGGGGEPARGDQFVASEDQVGSINLTVYTNPLGVGDTSKFRVDVFDAAGNPVPQARISCDSEREIAIVEPTTGIELTDAWGHMSGVLGCAAAGSFQLACRLPIGANKRKFVTVVCTGTAPAGFTGWPGAGGGTLGGGVETSDEAEENALSVRATEITFDDGPNVGTTSIDVVADTDCDDDPTTVDPEVFTDAHVNFTIVNDTNEFMRFTSYRYRVGSYTTPTLNLIGEVAVPEDGGTATFGALFMDASGGKSYYGGSPITADQYGFKNVTFTLFGTNANGEAIELTAATSVSIGNFDNCQ